MKSKIIILILVVAIGAGVYHFLTREPREIVLTGIVTTDDVIVSSEVQGRLQELKVKEGDHVKRGDLLAIIKQQQWEADMSFYASNEQQILSQVKQAEADWENARLNFEREEKLSKSGADSKQAYDQARTANDSAKARVEALNRQLQAATAQKQKAQVLLDYTEIHAPIDGIVDVRAAFQGEVVNMGQGIVTIINEDNLWVRADVEETYITRVKQGDKMKVRLPDGTEREGKIIYRAVDADYATQRDVSRTKRNIKTFELRLECDNKDRALAVGMTAYVLLPLAK